MPLKNTKRRMMMKIDIEENRIMLIPETEFEKQALWQMLGDNIRCWHKHGATMEDYIGLVIEKDDKNIEMLKEISKTEHSNSFGNFDKEIIEEIERSRYPNKPNNEPIYTMEESSIPDSYHPDFPNGSSAIKCTLDSQFTGCV